jgi:hypothetical protein
VGLDLGIARAFNIQLNKIFRRRCFGRYPPTFFFFFFQKQQDTLPRFFFLNKDKQTNKQSEKRVKKEVKEERRKKEKRKDTRRTAELKGTLIQELSEAVSLVVAPRCFSARLIYENRTRDL